MSDERETQGTGDTGQREGRPPRTTAERWTLAVSCVLIALVVGVVVASWVSGPGGPPVLVANATGEVEVGGGAYRVPFEVRNDGGETADEVQVVASLEVDGEVVGEGEQSFPFLSGGETESGEFLFTDDPSTGTLTIEVASYATP
jgi:uncharacterized protein (TIGR02588 family)